MLTSKKKRKTLCIILFVGIVILLSGALIFDDLGKDYSRNDITNLLIPKDFVLQNDEGCWVFDSEGTTRAHAPLRSPKLSLEKGSYTISVEYSTESSQSFDIYSKEKIKGRIAEHFFSASVGREVRYVYLPSGEQCVTAHFLLSEHVDDLEILFFHNGSGKTSIHKVAIQRSHSGLIEEIVALALFFLIVAGVLFASGVLRRFLYVALIILALSQSSSLVSGFSFLDYAARETSGNALSLLLLALATIYFVHKYYSNSNLQSSQSGRVKKFLIALAGVFALFMLLGSGIVSGTDFSNRSFSGCLFTVTIGIGYGILFYIIFDVLHYAVTNLTIKIPPFIDGIRPLLKKGEKHPLLTAALIIFVGSLPYVIVFLPGTIAWDGLRQLQMGLQVQPLTNHHPWLFSVLLAMFYSFFAWLPDNAILFLLASSFTFVEVICLAYVCTTVLHFIGKKGYWLSVAFFAIVPLFGLYMQMVIKDTLFSALFAAFTAFLLLHVVKKNQVDFKFTVAAFVLALLVSLLRHNGIYLIIPSFVFSAVYLKEGRGILLFTALAVLLSAWCINGPVREMAGVPAGRDAEMLSVPFQQTARYVKTYGDSLTGEEKEAINGVLDLEKLPENYNSQLADPVKGTYKLAPGADREPLKQYIKTWFKMGLKHPHVYIEAFVANSFGYYYPFYNCNSSEAFYNFIPVLGQYDGSYSFSYVFPYEVRRFALDYGELWRNYPVLAQIMNPGTYTWILLIIICFLLIHKKREVLFMAAPLINVLICVASPVNGLMRYALPLIEVTPLLIALFFFSISVERNSARNDVDSNKLVTTN